MPKWQLEVFTSEKLKRDVYKPYNVLTCVEVYSVGDCKAPGRLLPPEKKR